MKRNKIIATIILTIASSGFAFAQDTIMNKEVEVIKAFQPTISESNKIVSNPKINDTVKYTPIFDYRIQSSLVPVPRSIQKLPVVQLGNPPQSRSNTGYLRGGFGNAYTPFAEFALNTSPAKATDFGIFFSHFSSSPKVKLNNGIRVKAPYSDDVATIFVKNKFRKSVLDWNIGFERNRFNYYGFASVDTLLYRETENISNTLNKKQVFNNASALFNLRKIDGRSEFSYDVSVGYNFFWNSTGQKSHKGGYNGKYLLDKRNFDIVIGSEIDYFYTDSINNPYKLKSNHQYVFVALSPQYVYEKKNIILKAGINVSTVIDDDTDALFHISPKIYFEYQPIANVLSVFAATDGKLNVNDYQSVMQYNRYYNFANELKPSNEVINLSGGFKGKFSRKMSYVFDVSYSICQDEAFFYLLQNQYEAASDELKNLFSANYYDLNTLRFGGDVRYSSKSFSLGLNGNYYSYSSNSNVTITHRPTFDAQLTSLFDIGSSIKVRLDAQVIGSRKAEIMVMSHKNDGSVPAISQEFQTIKTAIGISAGADYAYNKKLSFSLDVRNIINQNYELWHGYNTQGILVLAGARYTF